MSEFEDILSNIQSGQPANVRTSSYNQFQQPISSQPNSSNRNRPLSREEKEEHAKIMQDIFKMDQGEPDDNNETFEYNPVRKDNDNIFGQTGTSYYDPPKRDRKSFMEPPKEQKQNASSNFWDDDDDFGVKDKHQKITKNRTHNNLNYNATAQQDNTFGMDNNNTYNDFKQEEEVYKPKSRVGKSLRSQQNSQRSENNSIHQDIPNIEKKQTQGEIKSGFFDEEDNDIGFNTRSRQKKSLNQKKDEQQSVTRGVSAPSHQSQLNLPPTSNQQKFRPEISVSPTNETKQIITNQNFQKQDQKQEIIKLESVGNIQEQKEQLETMKKRYEEQIKFMQQTQEQQLQYEIKKRQKMMEETEELFKKEKEKIKITHDQELKHQQQMFELKLQQEKMEWEANSENMKRQIESQQNLINLANEIKQNSEKLNLIQTQHVNQPLNMTQQTTVRNDYEIEQKEKLLKELENRLQVDKEHLEKEKARVDRWRDDLEAKERMLEQKQDVEKKYVRAEYSRLTELQDNIKRNEEERRKEYLMKEHQLLEQKELQDAEILRIKEDYQNQFQQLESGAIQQEQSKSSFMAQQLKLDTIFKQKQQEVDQLRNKLLIQESEQIKRQRAIELKEIEIQNIEKDQLLYQQRENHRKIAFENESNKVNYALNEYNKEVQLLKDFKQNYENEKMYLMKKEQELHIKQHQIDQQQTQVLNEKQNLQMMADTVQSLKTDYIKNFDPIKKRTEFAQIQNSKPGTFAQTLQANQNMNVQQKSYQNIYEKFSQTSMNQNQNNNFNRTGSLKQKQQSTQNENTKQNFTHNTNMNSKPPNAFNLNNFMMQLKQQEQSSMNNQNYINKEKEILLKSKLEADNSLYKGFSSSSNYEESLGM